MSTNTNISTEKQKELVSLFNDFNSTLVFIQEGEERIVKLSDLHASIVHLPESVYPGVNTISNSVVKRLKQTIKDYADSIDSYNESLTVINTFISDYPEIANILPEGFTETFLPL